MLETQFIKILLQNPKQLLQVNSIINEEMFTGYDNKEIYKTVSNLLTDNKEVDIISIHKANKKIPLIKLTELYKDFTIGSLLNTAILMREQWALNRAKEISSTIDDEATANEEIGRVISELEGLVFKAPETTSVTEKTMDYITRVQTGEIFNFKTGFKNFDRYVGGLAAGEYHIIAARPGVGKTALALSILNHNLHTLNLPAVFLSAEMTDRMILQRLIQMNTGVSIYDMKNENQLNGVQLDKIYNFCKLFESKNTIIRQITSMTPMEFKFLCKQLYQEYKPKIFVLDYVQKVASLSNGKRNIEIEQFSQTIADLTKTLDIPFLVLAQINRNIFFSSEEPDLHHLKDSGSLEQDADTVLMIYSRMVEGITQTELLLRKNRNGAVGRFEVNFNKNYSLFHDLDRTPEWILQERAF